MNPSNQQIAADQTIDTNESEAVAGGNENSYNAGVQIGQTLGGAYQSVVNYVSEVTLPYWLD